MSRLGLLVPALVVGAVAGGVSYLLGSTDPFLTGSIVMVYTLGTRLSFVHPDVVYEGGRPDWTVRRWSAAATAFVLLVVFFGLSRGLPIERGLRLSLRILVLGTGYAMWALGLSYARAEPSA